MENYRIEISKVDNGYYIRINNDNRTSKIFENLDKAIEYLRKFFAE